MEAFKTSRDYTTFKLTSFKEKRKGKYEGVKCDVRNQGKNKTLKEALVDG